LQFRENLPDRQAAEAVRAHFDRKYLLGLDLTDPGFDHSVLCESRARLLEGSAEERLPRAATRTSRFAAVAAPCADFANGIPPFARHISCA
jgi:hypothetical protein